MTNVNDVQKLLGDIQSIRPWAGISNIELEPLRKLLVGTTDITELKTLSKEAKVALDLVAEKIESMCAYRYDETMTTSIYLVNSEKEIVAIIGQHTEDKKTCNILEWVFLKAIPVASLTHRADLIGELLLKARCRVRVMLGVEPKIILLPFKLGSLIDEWKATSLPFSTATLGIKIDNHYPKSPIFAVNLPFKGQSLLSPVPLPDAPTVFTDASGRAGKYGYVTRVCNEWESKVAHHSGLSVQVLELKAVLLVLQDFCDVTVNIVCDSLYVFGLLQKADDALIGKISSPHVERELLQMLNEITLQKHAFFVTHIRSHTNLPGFLSQGNATIDHLVSATANVSGNSFRNAQDSHNFFHQSANSLQQEFNLTKSEARAIIATCPNCARIMPVQEQGTNPRGLSPRKVFQSDVTIVPSFGRLKHVHVSVDTYSKAVWATPMAKATSKATCRHWLETFAALGLPEVIKTDNGPNYVSKNTEDFLAKWGIKHLTGIPYNSTGQAIIERRHQDLKRQIHCLLKEGEVTLTPHEVIAKALFVINWKNLVTIADKKRLFTPIQLHFLDDNDRALFDVSVQMWDPIKQIWEGPVKLLTWGRGYACVSTGDQTQWIPAKWVKPWIQKTTQDEAPKKEGAPD